MSLSDDTACPRGLTIYRRPTDDAPVHIPDGLLDVGTSASTTVISAAAIGYALRRVRIDLPEHAAPLMGMTAACLFAAQTLNLPLIIAPASGHVLGGVLAAVLLGPWGGMVTVAAVVVVQCLLFQDGGVTALGANVLLLGVIGSGLGYAMFATVRRWIAGPAGVVAGAAGAAWFSVQLSAIAASMLIAAGPNFELGQILGVMVLAHSVIGLGESVVTGLALSFLLRNRPDLIYGSEQPTGRLRGLGQFVLAGGGTAVVLAVIAAPFASSLPDGLERTLRGAGFEPTSIGPAFVATWLEPPLTDYQFPGLEHIALAGSVAATLGVVAVFLLAYAMARAATASASTPAHRSNVD